MTGPSEQRGETRTSRADGPVCILDAVVCVHFAGANLNRVLTAALEFAGWVILVPEEVCGEVRRKDAKYPGLAKRWAALERSPHLRVLPMLRLGDSARARAVEVLEELREAEFEQAVRERRDLGECVVVAHGVQRQEQGEDVTLLMDDAGGLAMAAARNLVCATIEDVLVLAIHAGCFATAPALKDAYRRLREFGSGLPGFPQTTLSAQFAAWSAGR
ncbi:hypothetical protein [Kitasatospora sp. NPDC091207]|uniref:hypothetical protein n=1 Tax=Kitasatospora sp. NPDC091207 TaxID=3364083 RepID=UPI0038184708